jgi:hypothetical protein
VRGKTVLDPSMLTVDRSEDPPPHPAYTNASARTQRTPAQRPREEVGAFDEENERGIIGSQEKESVSYGES